MDGGISVLILGLFRVDPLVSVVIFGGASTYAALAASTQARAPQPRLAMHLTFIFVNLSNLSAAGSPGALGSFVAEASVLGHPWSPNPRLDQERMFLFGGPPHLLWLAPEVPARGRREHSGHRRVDERFRITVDPVRPEAASQL